MENSKKDYLIIVVDPEEDEVVGLFIAPEEKFLQLNEVQPPEKEMADEPGPELYYPEEREKIRMLRRQEMEKKRRLRRLLRWMM